MVPYWFTDKAEPHPGSFVIEYRATRADGVVVPNDVTTFGIPASPGLLGLRLLFPGSFFGFSSALDDGAIGLAFREEGQYYIMVRVSTSARTDIRGEIAQGRIKRKDLPVGLEDIFEGSLEAPTVRVSVQAPAG